MAFVLQHRKDTAANWASNNPTLKAGEIGVESDTNGVKVGDGTTAWKALPYINEAEVDAATLFPTKAPDTGGRDIFYKNDVHGAINISLGNLEPGQSLIFNHKDTNIPTLGTGIIDCWGLKFKYLKQYADNWLKLTKVNQTTALLQGLTDRPYGQMITISYYYPGSITTDTWLYAFPETSGGLNPDQSSPSAHSGRTEYYVIGMGKNVKQMTIPEKSVYGDPAARITFYGDYYINDVEVPPTGTGSLRRWDYYAFVGFSGVGSTTLKNMNSAIVPDCCDYASDTRQLKWVPLENIYPAGIKQGPLFARVHIDKPGTELINLQFTVALLLPFNTYNHSDP